MAEADLATTLEGDWGVPVLVTDPNGKAETLQAQAGDIGALIDPDTGIPVSGRLAHVALRLSSLKAKGFDEIPKGIASPDEMPWRFQFDGLAGGPHEFAVRNSHPDQTLGVVICLAEHWVA